MENSKQYIPADARIPFGCYYIEREYLDFLRKRGDAHVPRADYEDSGRTQKFYCGPVFNADGINYFLPVSHQTNKGDMTVYDVESRETDPTGAYIIDNDGVKLGNLDYRYAIPCMDNELLKPVSLSKFGQKQFEIITNMKDAIGEQAKNLYDKARSGDYPVHKRKAIDFDSLETAAYAYADLKEQLREQAIARITPTATVPEDDKEETMQ